MNFAVDGYTCPICQQYVLYASVHNCPGYNPTPFNQPALPNVPSLGAPGAMPMSGCRAPWTPLTLEDIRKVVREEIERRFPPTPDSAGEKHE